MQGPAQGAPHLHGADEAVGARIVAQPGLGQAKVGHLDMPLAVQQHVLLREWYIQIEHTWRSSHPCAARFERVMQQTGIELKIAVWDKLIMKGAAMASSMMGQTEGSFARA